MVEAQGRLKEQVGLMEREVEHQREEAVKRGKTIHDLETQRAGLMRKLRASETARRHAENETQAVHDSETKLLARLNERDEQLRSSSERVGVLEGELEQLKSELATTTAKTKVTSATIVAMEEELTATEIGKKAQVRRGEGEGGACRRRHALR